MAKYPSQTTKGTLRNLHILKWIQSLFNQGKLILSAASSDLQRSEKTWFLVWASELPVSTKRIWFQIMGQRFIKKTFKWLILKMIPTSQFNNIFNFFQIKLESKNLLKLNTELSWNRRLDAKTLDLGQLVLRKF